MHIGKDDIPVKIDAPGARARVSPGFGSPDAALAAEYFSLAAGTDISPLLRGLDGDLCHAPHWGYVLTGEVVVTYGDGSSETCVGGDLFHWPAGHTVRVLSPAELVMFSPQSAHGDVLDHMLVNMAEASS